MTRNSTNASEVFNAMFSTDTEWLHFSKEGNRVGWVFFVYGNSGYDVISDYTVNMEALLTGAHEVAKKAEASVDF